MYLIIAIIVLFALCIFLDIKDKKTSNNVPKSDQYNIEQYMDYEEKIRKYKDDYFSMSPIFTNKL